MSVTSPVISNTPSRTGVTDTTLERHRAGIVCHPNLVRLTLNVTNMGLFQIAEPKCTESNLKNPRFVPFEANPNIPANNGEHL